MSNKIDKAFVSELDQFINKLRDNVPENDSQRRERKKYERINRLRDNDQQVGNDLEIWEDF